MNVTGLPIQFTAQTKMISREKIPTELSNVFQSLLQNVKLPTALVTKSGGQVTENPNTLLQNLLSELPKESKVKLLEALQETGDIGQAIEGLNLSPELIQQLQAWLGAQSGQALLGNESQASMEAPIITATIRPMSVPVDKKEIMQQMAAIKQKAEALLSGINDQKNVTKIAPEIQKLLEKWTALEKKLLGAKESNITLTSEQSTSVKKTDVVWRELVNAYQKRNQLVTSKQYNSDAKVTSTDVGKWISNALSKQGIAEQATTNHVTPSSTPLSKVEQYVIHVNQTQNTQSAGQQLVEKFQEVIKTSKFLTLNNGSTQLSISLKPGNLGNLMVKLTQINGEMTMKIIVASAAAKDMLESNLTQLKHMFSPQQVVIEKQEMHTHQSQSMHQEKNQQSMESNDQNHSQHSEQDEHKQSNEDFESFFQEVLMNEKV